MAVLRYAILLCGIAFYAFSITTLLKLISNYLLIFKEMRTSSSPSGESLIQIKMELFLRRSWMPLTHALNTIPEESIEFSHTTVEMLILTISLIKLIPEEVLISFILSFKCSQALHWRCCCLHWSWTP